MLKLVCHQYHLVTYATRNFSHHYLSSEQIKFLQLHPFDEGFTLRSEWGLKHLAVHAAEKGVEILTRTRITHCVETEDGFSIEFQGGGSNSSDTIQSHFLVNDIQWTYQAPGAKHHALPNSKKVHVPDFRYIWTDVWRYGTQE